MTDVVLEIGTNDTTLGKTATHIIQGLRHIVSVLHHHGICVIGATLVPRGAYKGYTALMDATRAHVNQFIRTSRIFEGVLDIAISLFEPVNDNLYRPRYDSGDHLHPNTAGRRAIANRLKLAFLR